MLRGVRYLLVNDFGVGESRLPLVPDLEVARPTRKTTAGHVKPDAISRLEQVAGRRERYPEEGRLAWRNGLAWSGQVGGVAMAASQDGLDDVVGDCVTLRVDDADSR